MRVLKTPTLRTEPPAWAALEERMAWRGVPGVGVAVIEGDEVVRAEGFGVKEAGAPDPVTPETLFLAGSISKPVAALGALRLVEQGRLALDEDVNKYLRSWSVPPNGAWRPRVTLRQLLSHTAGMTVHGFPGYAPDEPLPTLVQVLDGVPPANTPPIRVNLLPGVQFRYSGGGYCVLQQLMVDVVGRPFPDLIRELVLEPAGMARSSYANPLPEARRAEAATGHRASARPVHGRWQVYPEMAAAGLWTTPSDLARFAIALRRAAGGRAPDVLSAESARVMLTGQAAARDERIGLGMFLRGDGETARFGHTGSDEGFVCELDAYRHRGHGAVVMTNADRPWPLIEEVLGGLAAELGWPEYAPGRPEAVFLDAAAVAGHAGGYELPSGARLELSASADGLLLRMPGQDPIPLRARAEGRFFAEAVDLDVDVTPDGLTLRQEGVDTTARRL